MLLFAAAAIAASSPQDAPRAPVAAAVQARAMVRIVSGVRLKWGQDQGGEIPAARTTLVQTPAGPQQARLIEFE